LVEDTKTVPIYKVFLDAFRTTPIVEVLASSTFCEEIGEFEVSNVTLTGNAFIQ
jgi:hypothetical protein